MSINTLDSIRYNKQSKAYYDEIRSQIRKIVEEVIRPNAERIDEEGDFPRENLQALIREGWGNVLVPKKYNGLGLDHVAFAIAAEEIGKACAVKQKGKEIITF